MNQSSNNSIARILWLVILAIAAYLVYATITASNVARTTGVLDLRSPDKSAILSISQAERSAEIIGTGAARVRLQPGAYLVAASASGHQTAAVVRIDTHKTTTQTLNPAKATFLPSPDNIDFQGLDALIADGLTTDQANNVKQLFFTYKSSAKKIVINPGSVQPGPHDPNGANPIFTLNFSGTIDGTAYEATATYADLTNIQLVLKDPKTHVQLYSGTTNTPAS